jgi:oligopeptide/dipeptide ABC transporter ATP-binding protein
MNELLRVENLEIHFQSRKGLFSTTTVKAVDGVSFSLYRGETLALVGESGSGKTTLGRATLKLLDATGGRFIYGGQDLTKVKEGGLGGFRRKAQAIFQDPYASLSPYMRVYDLVEEPLKVQSKLSQAQRESRVFEALEKVRLAPARDFASKYPHTLSGGQRQRVNIARALVLNPEYILADEPVSMIDASSRAELLYLLRELQQASNLSFLYITHDLASARHFAGRIAVMYLGRIVELAPSAELIENPLHPYTQALLRAVPEPDPANRLRLREVAAGEPANAAHIPPGCSFHPRCPAIIKGSCEAKRPELLEVKPGHWVACHLHPG